MDKTLTAIQFVNHTFRSSIFFLLNAISKELSSSSPAYRNRIRCRAISVKYSFASFDDDVPKPIKQIEFGVILLTTAGI